MRTRHLLTAIAALSVVALLSGCTPAKPYDKTATSTSSPTPVFASEEEALAAAEEVYRSYASVSDLIASQGGKDPARIEPFVTSGWLSHEMEVFRQFEQSGKKQLGNSVVRRSSIQSLVSDGGFDYISAYVCVDLSGVSFVDAQGVDVTPLGKGDVIKLLVEFEAVEHDNVRISGSEPWTGELEC